jgi:hypothetical protein
LRTAAALLIIFVAFGVLLSRCPSFREGMAGKLANAQEESESATQTGLLALDLWRSHKSTEQLAAVQLADARDEVTKNYKSVAELTATHDDDLRQQHALLDGMTDAIVALTTAAAVVHGVDSATSPEAAGVRLTQALAKLTAAGG